MAPLTRTPRVNPATNVREPYFRIAWRSGGVQHSVTLGFCGEAVAEAALASWTKKHAAGESRPPAGTLGTWWGTGPEWQASPMLTWVLARGYAPKTVSQANSARLWIVRVLGDVALGDVGQPHADRLLVELRAAGRSSRCAQVYLCWLERSLNAAQTYGRIAHAPKLARPRDTDHKPTRWLTQDQTAAVYAALDRLQADGRARPGTVLAIRMQETLVMRPGEVRHRRWEDLQVNGAWATAQIQVRAVDAPGVVWKPKGLRPRTLAVPPVLLERLRDHWLAQGQPRSGWIFPGAGQKPLGNVKKALATACRMIGVPVVSPHGLRHSGATRLATLGVERRTLMQIGGWTSAETLDEVYSHTTDARMLEVLRATEVGCATGSVAQPVAQPAFAKGAS